MERGSYAGKTDMIELHENTPSSGDQNYLQVFRYAAIFAVVTYAALSARAVLNPYEVQHFLDAKRIVSVGMGAMVLWFAIRAAVAEQSSGLRAQVSAVLRVSILGTVFVLMSREAYDLAVSSELAQQIGRNIRWMLSWIGYFSAAVAAYFAMSFYRQLQLIGESNVAHRIVKLRPAPQIDQEDIDMLMALLQRQAGYETADVDIRPESQAFRQCQRKIDRLRSKFTETKKS